MIDRFVLFGATGDLAGRYVLPALAALHEAGELPGGFRIEGAARQPLDDDEFRRRVATRLHDHAPGVTQSSRDAVVAMTHYRQVDVTDVESVDAVRRDVAMGADSAPLVAYLALPPELFAPTIKTLDAVGLPEGSRVVVEKPFGEDLDDAVALNGLLAGFAGTDGRPAGFRVDHFLGLRSVHNLLGLRLANRVLVPVWNHSQIERVDIVWEETLGLEGRASYYDHTGQLRDMIQSHLLQVLALFAMEPPERFDERELHDRKLELLRAIRPPRGDDVARRTRRARYTAGRIGDRTLPAYADEDGVDPERRTETFAEVELSIDNDRWSGTRFVLRTGKALARDRMEVRVRFRPLPHHPLGFDGAAPANELCIALDPSATIALAVNGASVGARSEVTPLELCGEASGSRRSPYYPVLLDVLRGGSRLSVRGDEAEQSWRIVAPVLEAWSDDAVPMLEYSAGSGGPAPR